MGLRKELESQLNLNRASHRVLRSLDDNDGPLQTNSTQGSGYDPSDSSVTRLNLWAQSQSNLTECPAYTYSEDVGRVGIGGRTEPRFGCKLKITVNSDPQQFEVAACYPNKKLAKEAVARLALESGLGGSIPSNPRHTIPTQPEDLITHDSCISHLSEELRKSRTSSYETHKNFRITGVANRIDETSSSPMLTTPGASSDPIPTRTVAEQAAVHSTSSRQFLASPAVLGSSLQPNLKILQQQLSSVFPKDGFARLKFAHKVDGRSGLFCGSLTIELEQSRSISFDEEARHGSAALCQEALAAKALNGNFWTQLSTIAQRSSEPVISPDSTVGQPDHFYHPVSYVHQVCVLLLGPEAANKPTFEVFQPANGGPFAAKLTLPTNPPKIYDCPAEYKNKALAKEAVAALAISKGLLGFLKQQSLRIGTDNKLMGANRELLSRRGFASLTKLEQVNVNINGKRPLQGHAGGNNVRQPYIERLTSYCKETGRPVPVFRTWVVPGQEGPASEKMISAAIGEQVFETVESRSTEQDGKAIAVDRLAKRILRHLTAKDSSQNSEPSIQ
ncbi:hypothetical protein P389DRAFT_10371 [Cystobasidium minutum MCA 4210]|uniref:uncharacterized protein n=1 Tax=Cystobasidium minutum MCA 4210 TaxID=1397322 RepID=UPI0034CE47C0|eukprot:jgi/Rhomi1/10371/CE10370_357